jgi:acyl-CoA thioester hydrolase
VRFEEVDALGIVWHGRYASYFEDARVALGAKYGIGYLDFHRQGIAVPLKILHVDFMLPLTFGEEMFIEASLHWNEAARLNHSYVIHNAQGDVTTTGYTVQLFLDPDHQLLVTPTDFLQEFLDRWKAGKVMP